MSWSFSAVGKPDAVQRAIEASSNNKSTGQSLDEWNAAKPALLALVGANQGNVVRLTANGSASVEVRPTKTDSEGSPVSTERVRTSGSCTCTLESLYGFVE
jgi:hypothetical protein